jgi:hypothetical protein
MDEINMSENTDNTAKGVENTQGATRVRESELARLPKPQPGRSTKTASKKQPESCDSVSVEKMKRADGAEVTTVVHPARYLKRAGELRAALLSNDAIDLDNFADGCVEGMNAMKAIPCKDGAIAYEPDWATRLAYRKFVTETVEGMPIKRQEIVSRKLTTQDDLMEKAKQSPALLRSLLESLTQLDKQLRDEEGSVDKSN